MRRALVLLLLVTGCALPLPKGVRSGGEVEGGQQRHAGLQVIPPGPKDGQAPVDVVTGFLGAQANAEDDHGIAREFLAPARRGAWNDDAEVQVYLPETLRIEPQLVAGGAVADRATVTVTATVTGEVGRDGGYVAQSKPVTERYSLQQVSGQWRLTSVPPGLRLTAADLQRAFLPRNVYYLAVGATGREQPHLVPDRVFLPDGPDLALVLVTRMLQPPSQALDGSVTTGTPIASRLRVRSVTTSGSGVVTVDLTGVGPGLSSRARQDLSARLVWTLRELGPSFTGLRLRVDGEPLAVPGEGTVQDAGSWDAYDPDGLGLSPPYYYVADRRLRASVTLPATRATAGDARDPDAVAVDDVAVTPDRTEVALLDGEAPGAVTVHIGPLRGPTYPTVLTLPGLSSPSWGSGQHGLWLLRDGRDVVRVLPGVARPLPVVFVGQPAGTLQSLAVSRDGARVALVADGQAYVAQVELVRGTPRIVDPVALLPRFNRITDLSWSTSTELVLVGAAGSSSQGVMRVSVDGSSVLRLNTGNLQPQGVGAAPNGLVLDVDGGLYALTARGFARVATGRSPVFPG